MRRYLLKFLKYQSQMGSTCLIANSSQFLDNEIRKSFEPGIKLEITKSIFYYLVFPKTRLYNRFTFKIKPQITHYYFSTQASKFFHELFCVEIYASKNASASRRLVKRPISGFDIQKRLGLEVEFRVVRFGGLSILFACCQLRVEFVVEFGVKFWGFLHEFYFCD